MNTEQLKQRALEYLADTLTVEGLRKYTCINGMGYSQVERDIVDGIINLTEVEKLKALNEELIAACEKSLSVFKQLADAGRYPYPLMAQNGGEGFGFLTEVLRKSQSL